MGSERRTPEHELVDNLLASQPLPTGDAHACPYLPGKIARNEGFSVEHLPPSVYRVLLGRGFRRSGSLVYRPICQGCRECQQIRVVVGDFARSRSQRRAWRANLDVRVRVRPQPKPTMRKWQLFRDYLDSQHDDQMVTGYDDFARFLYDTPMPTLEFRYSLGPRLIGVSITDFCGDALSSVYMFFDPAHRRRSLGTFSILWEIEYCRRRGIPYYYLGYYVADCGKMAYKARFGPHEVLDGNFVWRRPSGRLANHRVDP